MTTQTVVPVLANLRFFGASVAVSLSTDIESARTEQLERALFDPCGGRGLEPQPKHAFNVRATVIHD